MILSDSEILKQRENGNIVIDPFDETCLGPNSYDVHLSKWLGIPIVKDTSSKYPWYHIDVKKKQEIKLIEIPEDGYLLDKNKLYLASTVEYTETFNYVPLLEGKSSLARLGIFVHITAGLGDESFCNYWTLEIMCLNDTVIYPGMPIAQLIYLSIDGKVNNRYNQRSSSKYVEKCHTPIPSQMWKNFSIKSSE